jgi:hypothetical protein
LPVWVSIALVNSRSDVPLVWSAPGLFSYSSGLPILSGSGTPAVGDGINSQLYVQTSTTPQTIWFKQSGTWNRLVGSTLYADLTSTQTIAGIKTFSSPIVGSVTGTAENVTGVVAIVNGGTSSTTASGARSALGVTATGQDTTYAYRANNLSDLASASTARTNLGLGSAAVLTAGAANGVATLDAGGTVPLSQIPASIQGGVSYQGTWNASTNTPTLTSSVGTKGYYYVVSTAGSTNLNGITSWNIGDWAIYNGTAWEKIDNTDAVTSVNGYTGTVVLTQPDIAGTASLTTVQTLTNKTLTSPKINEILDTNGNEILGLSPTASATDFVTIKNGIGVGVPLHVYADGPSTNIGLHIQPKGSGLVTISDGTDFNKGIRFRSSGSAASAVTLLDAVATAGRVVTLPDATTTLVGRDTTDTLTNKTIAFGSNTFSGSLAIANGGTGQTTANAAFNALVPSQTGNIGKYLTTNGTDTSWGTNPLGDVVGPASATANGIALFDGTTGKLLKDSASTDGLINGLTVGRGAGAVSTNTAVGSEALSNGSQSGARNTSLGFRASYLNTSGENITAVGAYALYSNDTGSNNIAVGYGAIDSNLSVSYNIGVGSGALQSNTTSSFNTSIGYQSQYNGNGTQNTSLGAYAMFTNGGGASNTALGYASVGNGTLTGSFNTSVGDQSLYNISSGSNNTAIGYKAGYLNTGASGLAVLGYLAAYKATTGSDFLVAIGDSAAYNHETGASMTAVGRRAFFTNVSGNDNTGVGINAGYYVTGSNNTALGSAALQGNTGATGSNNTAVGKEAFYLNTTASNNTGVGYQAGYNNTSGTQNVFIGHSSGYYNQTGIENTFIGFSANGNGSGGTASAGNTGVGRAVLNNNYGNYNTAVGNGALQLNSSASNNTAVGYQAGYSQVNGGATYNTYLGYSAGYAVTSGTRNTYLGHSSGPNVNLSTGSSNISVGSQSLTYISSGSNNTAMGDSALYNNTTASNNVAVGYFALKANQTGALNNALGYLAGQSLVDGAVNVAIGGLALATCVSGNTNTAVGHSAMEGGTGSGNTILGYNAGKALTTGSYNTIVGYYNGLTSQSNMVVLADGQQSAVFQSSPGYSVALYDATIKAGTGITFPASQYASSDANTLDDYEEGTWNPVLGDLSGNNFTMSVVDGRYTKIGNQVTATLIANWSSIGSVTSGPLRCTLPIACNGSDYARFSAALGYLSGFDTTLGTKQITSNLDQGLAYLTFYQTNDNASPTILPANSCSGSGGLQATITYFV